MQRPCNRCQLPFNVIATSTILLEKMCFSRSGAAHRRTGGQNHPQVKSGVLGALEHLVVADLLLKNYECFRATSPNCSCDLIASKQPLLFKVEVTAGHRSINNNLTWNKTVHPPSRYDVLAIVLPDRTILYLKPDGVEHVEIEI